MFILKNILLSISICRVESYQSEIISLNNRTAPEDRDISRWKAFKVFEDIR